MHHQTALERIPSPVIRQVILKRHKTLSRLHGSCDLIRSQKSILCTAAVGFHEPGCHAAQLFVYELFVLCYSGVEEAVQREASMLAGSDQMLLLSSGSDCDSQWAGLH